MSWEEYRQMYHGCELGISQTITLTLVAREILKEFSGEVPKDMRKPPSNPMKKMAYTLSRARSEVAGEAPQGGAKADLKGFAQGKGGGDWLPHVLPMVVAQVALDYPLAEVDFDRLCCCEGLVMLWAHLDAFMDDSLRAVCRAHPEVMKGGGKVDWDTVVESGGWEELLDRLSERYVLEFGRQSLSKRMEFFKERLGIEIECLDLKLLEEAERAKHAVAHNGGRVTRGYIRRTGRNELKVGDFVPVSLEYLDRVVWATRMLVGDLFVSVSKKFFDLADSQLSMVWRRSKPPSSF